MSDQIDTEEQRARMQAQLRYSKKALLFVIGENGEPCISYLNTNPIEYRGFIQMLQESIAKWNWDNER